MKHIILMVLFFCARISVFACDVCGCGAMNSTQGLGTLSQGNRTSIGVNYQHRWYYSEHPELFGSGKETANDYFQRIDLNGQLRLGNRWQLRAVLPYLNNKHVVETASTSLSGLGDVTLSGHYFLIDKEDSLKTNRFRWIAGGGLKLPSGKFTVPSSANLYLTPGTGACDGLFQNVLFYQQKRWSIVQQSIVIIRGTNKHGYQTGNQFLTAIFVQYKFKSFSLLSGAQYTLSGKDYLSRKVINGAPTAGSILTGIGGASYSFGSILIQGNYHLPIFQYLGERFSVQKTAFSLSINYFIN